MEIDDPSWGTGLYDDLLGTFIEEDISLDTSFDSLSQNRYIYVGDNPEKYIDPSGHNAAWIESTDYVWSTYVPPAPSVSNSFILGTDYAGGNYGGQAAASSDSVSTTVIPVRTRNSTLTEVNGPTPQVQTETTVTSTTTYNCATDSSADCSECTTQHDNGLGGEAEALGYSLLLGAIGDGALFGAVAVQFLWLASPVLVPLGIASLDAAGETLVWTVDEGPDATLGGAENSAAGSLFEWLFGD
ncbi:MAG: hypothetical protein ACRDF4_11235 [Rhabdochlamydiaceae bacterium]